MIPTSLDETFDKKKRKVLGAFYTPDRYVEISTRYVRDAIRRVQEEGFEDYVIIDRCAGTGNLEKMLTEEELSHCILNTYEAKEWIALTQIYAGRVRRIIPSEYRPDGTLLKGGDALTEEFLRNFTEEFRLRDEGRLAIIMLENPPYSDVSNNGNDASSRSNNKTWVKDNMIRMRVAKANTSNELINQFVWSGYEHFKPEYYIIYGPVKYWKSNHIINKELISSYLCNRKYFHAGEAGILLAYWSNLNNNSRSITCESDINPVIIKKIFKNLLDLSERKKPDDFLSFLILRGYNFNQSNFLLSDNPSASHLRDGVAFISRGNMLKNLPLFVANCFEFEDYTEKEVLMKSSDGGTRYQQDSDFLNDSLIYTLLTNKNKCSKTNEIYPHGFRIFNPREKHRELLNLWSSIYRKTNTYGLDNVIKECDTFTMRGNIRDYDDPILHKDIILLKEELKRFYIEHIKPKMLQYELVK